MSGRLPEAIALEHVRNAYRELEVAVYELGRPWCKVPRHLGSTVSHAHELALVAVHRLEDHLDELRRERWG